MLSFGAAQEIYLCEEPVDMRRSFAGLTALIEAKFDLGALSRGAWFVFVSRRRTHVKILWFDGDGSCLWYKRLSQGCFRVGFAGRRQISRRELTLLLEGIHPQRLNRRLEKNPQK